MKKRLIPIIIIIGVAIVGVLIYLFLGLNPERREELQQTVNSLFPFGAPETGMMPGGQQGPDVTEGETFINGQGIVVERAPLLRQITAGPVGGYQQMMAEIIEPVQRTVISESGVESVVEELRPVQQHIVRYADTETGSIQQTIVGANSLATEQLTDASIPHADRLWLYNNGSNIAFQYANGTVGMESIQTYLGSIQQVPLPVAACPFAFPDNIKFGNTSEAVANVQRFLNGYLGIIISQTGENAPGSETGVFDELTRQAVERFQASRGMAVDGSVGPLTRQAFADACTAIETRKAQERIVASGQKPYRVTGSFGPQNILDIGVAYGSTLAYVERLGQGSRVLLYDATTDTARQVFDSPFSEWLVQAPTSQSVFLTTKASGIVPGFSYELTPATRTFKKILGNINGLTTLFSPQGDKALYSRSQGRTFTLHLWKKADAATRTIGITTLPEKCVWGSDNVTAFCAVPSTIPQGVYPDGRYQGVIKFNDTFWGINTDTGATQQLFNPSDNGLSVVDAVALQISADNRYLYFINQNDGTLWVADLYQL